MLTKPTFLSICVDEFFCVREYGGFLSAQVTGHHLNFQYTKIVVRGTFSSLRLMKRIMLFQGMMGHYM